MQTCFLLLPGRLGAPVERDYGSCSILPDLEPFEEKSPSAALGVDCVSHLVGAVAEVCNVLVARDRSRPGFVEFAHTLLLLLFHQSKSFAANILESKALVECRCFGFQPAVRVVAKSEVNRHILSLQLLQRNAKLDTVGNCEQGHFFN